MSLLRNIEEKRTSAVYALIILMGFILSYVVYFSVSDVERTTTDLVDKQIPTLSLIRETMASVAEQERILYEYYATTDESLYGVNYVQAHSQTQANLSKLAHLIFNDQLMDLLYNSLTVIEQNAANFQRNIQSNNTDWDLARVQLSQISQDRRQISTLFIALEHATQQDVTAGYNSTLQKLSTTNTTVLIYSLSIVIIALVTGWYMRIYFKVSVRNKRLALFTQRNPHPIISINQDNKILYFNPATTKLLADQQLKLNQDIPLQMSDLIPPAFIELTTKAKKCNAYTQMEYSLAELELNCEIHWLNDLNVFDLHISDISAEKKAKEKLKYQAFHCPVTGLKNSYKLTKILDIEVKKQNIFSLGLLEIRHYNRYVAGHGVESTRELIRAVATRLNTMALESKHDVELFKLNERTFSFILSDCVQSDIIEQFCGEVETQMQKDISTDFGQFNIELDFGFCSFPNHGDSTNTMLQHARMALDEAICIEHSSFRYFDHQLSEQLNYILKLTNWLKVASAAKQLSLVYQPQLNIADNSLIGMETLMRWNRDGQHISPADFIPIAEQTGLIIEIGQWLLIEACTMARELVVNGHDQLVLAVNISPRQFRHPEFLAMIQSVLARTGLAPQRLELEITEGVILYNESETISVLNQLKALGIQLSIDDFGTGYSSLSYLKQFPIDKLKIDQSFISNLHTNQEDKAIVQAIIDLGKNLGLKVIAEGVEELVHYEFLKSLNCDEIQGYWYSRPLDKDKFITFIEQQKG
jgi:EAL domain-containing protein (putative c-di-GMP-specific phosphodiesterase class I)/GGDEF domain-containing protein/PAS domain-containing protein